MLLVVFFWWWLCSGFWRRSSCGHWSFSLLSFKFCSLALLPLLFLCLMLTPTPRRHYSCIILNLTHDTLCLTPSWLISPRSCNMLFHWPLLDSFSQDGLRCIDKSVQRSNDRHGGRDEMDKTPKYPQHPSAFSFRNS